jgi:hypothetical protein
MVYNALRVIPVYERLEVVLEQQDRYGIYAASAMQVIADARDSPQTLTADGQPKLANWKFIPKYSTSLTEPGDYLAYALFQLWKDQTSRRSIWCKPIVDAHKAYAIGHIWKRSETREIALAGPLRKILQIARSNHG